jgi:DNA repair protein RecO
MSYAIYTTEALVCGNYASRTADKSYLLFTKDAGMLYATATSVREERSKQRYALQDFSLLRVSLVRGKSGWRIGSAEIENNIYHLALSRQARIAAITIVKLIRQFVRGEDPIQSVYQDTKTALLKICDSKLEPSNVVEIFTLRLLHHLGYVAPKDTYSEYLNSSSWWQLEPIPQSARKAITEAKHDSHL